MKLLRISTLLLFFGLLLTGCYQEVNLKVPFEGSKMVLKGFLTPTRGLDLKIKKTLDPYSYTEFDENLYHVTHARVEIRKHGVLIDTCRQISKGHYLSSHPDRVQGSEAYEIFISAPDLPDAVVQNVSIPVKSLVFPDSFSLFIDYENKGAVLNASLVNPKYYAIFYGRAWYDSRAKNELEVTLDSGNSIDQICDDDWRYFSNRCIAGTSFQKSFNLYPFEQIEYPWGDKVFLPQKYIYIEVGQIDPVYKNYITKSDSADEPFIEPSLDAGNVEGGYGFIAGWNVVGFTYRL